MRFIREFFNPGLKCDRLGCDEIVRRRRIRRRAELGRRAVVVDYLAYFKVCRRCKRESEPYDEVEIESYQSCTMPESMWRDMREKGWTYQ